MAETHGAALAHQFDDVHQQKEASTLGMWVFLVTEVMFFGGLFAAYLVYRAAYPAAWAEASHELDIMLGGINTVILICSSLTMALAVQGAQLGRRNMLIIFLALTILLGGAFLGIKMVEYHHKYVDHHVPGASFAFPGEHAKQVELFFAIYFTMTGMHGLHMVIGIGLLANLMRQGWRGRFGSGYYTPVEMVGLYWHFVDIVWIFLFPLLYLLGRH